MTDKTENVKLAGAIAGAFTILGLVLCAVHLENLGWYLILISSGCGIFITFVAGIILKEPELLAGLVCWPIVVGFILKAGNPTHPIQSLICPAVLAIIWSAGVGSTVIHVVTDRGKT